MLAATDPNRMLTTHEVADLMGLQPTTLAAWRETGAQPGLAFFKLGKAVRYRYADVAAFIEARRADSTLIACMDILRMKRVTPKRAPVAAIPSPVMRPAVPAQPSTPPEPARSASTRHQRRKRNAEPAPPGLFDFLD